MRKPLALATIAMIAMIAMIILALAACSKSTPAPAVSEATPAPHVSATPSPTPAPRQAKPTRMTPLQPLTDATILSYCPDIPAVHFSGKASEVTKVYICTSVPSQTGTTENASWVNFGMDALMSAYSEANATVSADPCVRTAKDPMIVWVTDSSETTYPIYAPVDGCGYPNTGAVAAYNAVGLQILNEVDLDANGTRIDP